MHVCIDYVCVYVWLHFDKKMGMLVCMLFIIWIYHIYANHNQRWNFTNRSGSWLTNIYILLIFIILQSSYIIMKYESALIFAIIARKVVKIWQKAIWIVLKALWISHVNLLWSLSLTNICNCTCVIHISFSSSR